MIVEVKNLELLKKKNNILHSISFSIEQGSIACLVGRNGAGKTSLLRCIVGLENRFEGSISIFGESANTNLLGKLGIMLGGLSLYSYLTGRENLEIIRRYYGLPQESVSKTLDLVGLTAESNKLVKYYSDGMKQRLAIGMAFIHQPLLVILDEPLNALDPEAVVEIRHLIKRLNQSFGTTFLITSHSLEEIGKIFTQLIILKQGNKVLDMQREELDSYWIIEGNQAQKEEIYHLINSLKEVALFHKITDEDNIAILGHSEILAGIKSNYAHISWNKQYKATIEDIYLFANA